MNSLVALCHFCESHGPCAIFCTQTLRDTKIEDITEQQLIHSNSSCASCNSLGPSNSIYSQDKESGATFLSTQTPTLPDVVNLVKQAAVRSLSCEINCNKDGGFVFFGDSSRGHTLSYTFHVSDSQARGFQHLFSIIILMKDKYFLLNIKPFLAENFKRISNEIQTTAQKVYDHEVVQGSPWQRRLSINHQPQAPRSLLELTGEHNIFPILHSHFSWILLAGSRVLTEHITFGNLPWLSTNTGLSRHFLGFPKKSLDDHCEEEQEEYYSLRTVKELLQADFVSACYCALTGIKIIVRGPPTKTYNLMVCLRRLLPEPMYNTVQHNGPQYLENSECRIVSVSSEIGVPVPSNSIFRIDFLHTETGVEVCIKWNGTVPNKWPDLLSKVVKAVEEPLFNDLVLNKQTKVLVEEWKNKINCIQRAKTSSGLLKLKQVLGIMPQDQPLVIYWSHALRNQS